MQTYHGKVASKGIAIGTIVEYQKKEHAVRREPATDIAAEIALFFDAQKEAMRQLADLHQKAVKEVGQAGAALFEVHQMMLEDQDYVDAIVSIIQTQKVNAVYAVATTGDNFASMFSGMDDDYMKERAADVKDISDRVVRVLCKSEAQSLDFSEASIVVADDLSPSETVQMDKSKVIAFVTRKGSVNSHTAILSRTMGIAALVNTPIPQNVHGKKMVVDGFDGICMIEPTPDVLEKAHRDIAARKENELLLQQYKGKKAQTKTGRVIKLFANIGGVSDIAAVLQNDADGIGLFRSEFIYLQQNDFPTEEQQFVVYKQAAEMMAGKKVIIRTMDIGADKQIDYFGLEQEENPALGYRAVRICLTEQHIFKTQLRALLRAAAYGNLAIMIPMIISVWEVQKTKEILAEVEEELRTEGIPFGQMELGVMIETPAAVMIADELAKEVDFFSIGTNDLTQYALALDRQNPKLDAFYNAHHPAVLKMIALTAKAAKDNGIWAGICGELAADTSLTQTFLSYGIEELSVSPAMVLPVKKAICEAE